MSGWSWHRFMFPLWVSLGVFIFSFSINHALFSNRLIVISRCRGGMQQAHASKRVKYMVKHLVYDCPFKPKRSHLTVFLVQSEVCQQLTDGLAWNYVQEFMVPRSGLLLTLGIHWFFFKNHHEVNIYGYELSTSIGWITVKQVRITLNNLRNNFSFNFFSSIILFLQYFGLWPNQRTTNYFPMSLSCCLC